MFFYLKIYIAYLFAATLGFSNSCPDLLGSKSQDLRKRIKIAKAKLAKLKVSKKDNAVEKAQAVSEELYSLVKETARRHNQKKNQDQFIFPMVFENYFRVYFRGSSTSADLPYDIHKKFKVKFSDGKLLNYKGKPLDTSSGTWIYCIYGNRMYVSQDAVVLKNGEKIAHPTICKGNAILAAGELKVKRGKLISMNTNSGRYRLPPFSIKQAEKFLKKKKVKLDKASFKFYFRKEAYLSTYDINRMMDIGVPPSDKVMTLFEKGQEYLVRQILRMREFRVETSKKELFNFQDFLIDWGALNEPIKTEVTEFFTAYFISTDVSLNNKIALMDEMYRTAPVLDMERITQLFILLERACNSQKNLNCQPLAEVINRRYFGKLGLN